MLRLMDNALYNFTTFCVYLALYEQRIAGKGRCPKRRERREKVKKTALFEISILLRFNYENIELHHRLYVPHFDDI